MPATATKGFQIRISLGLAVLSISCWLLTACQAEEKGKTSPVRCLSFSPDGKQLASAHKDGTVRIAEVIFGKVQQILKTEGILKSLSYSPKGDRIAAGGEDGRIVMWQADGDRFQQRWQTVTKGGMVAGLAFSPDGKWLVATTVGSGWILFLDPAKGIVRRKIVEFGNGVGPAAFTPDGKTLITGGQDFRSWDVESADVRADKVEEDDLTLKELTEREKRTVRLRGLSSWTTGLCVSPDGKWAAAGGAFGPEDQGKPRSVVLVDLVQGKIARRLAHDKEEVASVACSSDGRYVAAGGSSGLVRTWHAPGGKLARLFNIKGQEIRSMAFLPRTAQLAVAGDSGVIELWDVETGHKVKVFGP